MAKSTTIDGVSLHYVESGTGPPVLFVHGFGASSFCWRGLRQYLPGRRLIALDMKGFGDSDKPDDGKYSVSDQAALLRGFVKALDLKDFVVVGHSLGGAVTLRALPLIAQDSPHGVNGVVLIDTIAYPQPLPSFIKWLRTPILRELVLYAVPPRTAAKMVLKEVYYDHSKLTAETVDTYAHYMSLPGAPAAFADTAASIIPDNITDMIAGYSKIQLPVLLIWGDHDRIVPRNVADRLVKAIPNARLEIIKDCGHAPHEEMPEDTAKLIADFLTRVPNPPSRAPSVER